MPPAGLGAAHLGAALDAQAGADLDHLADALAEPLSEEVVIEDAGGAGVGDDVGIALQQMRAGERPVVERGTCVVVLYERHRSRRPHAQQAGRPPLAVNQPPVFPSAHRLLQDACAHPCA